MADSGSYDEATLARRYAMAQKLMEQGQAPVTHWAQGLANLANSALGGYEYSKADDERRSEKTKGTADLYGALGLPAPAAAVEPSQGGFQKLAALLNGGGGGASAPPPDATAASLPPPGADQASYAPPPAPGPPPVTFRPGTTAPAMPADTSGKIYSNNEPSPLDPPVGADRAKMMATILGEAGNEPQLGKDAVASVIRTRAVDGGYGGDTPSAVVTAKNQFEPWNTEAGKARMAAALLNPAQANAADAAIKSAYGEGGKAPNDPTEGMTHFYSPGGQAALGRPNPAWAGGDSVTIGGHVFNSPDDKIPANAVVAQGALPTAAQAAAPTDGGILAGVTPEKKAQIAQLLTSTNPTAKALGTTMLQQYAKPETTDEIKEYNLAKKQGFDGSFFEYKTGLKKAGAQNITTNVGGGSDKQIFDTMDESAKAARTTAQGLTGLREARNAIQGGVITGAGADAKLALQKVGASLGVVDPAKIVNTETFRSAIAPQVAAMIKSTVGTTNISNTDREFAEKAAGGNINLDEKSITRLLDVMERAGSAQLEGHQKRLEKVYPDPEKYARERALFGVDMPAAPPAPPAAAAPAAKAPVQGQTATNPKTGEKIVLKDGQWVPAQ